VIQTGDHIHGQPEGKLGGGMMGPGMIGGAATMDAICPMGVAGTAVATSDTPDGVAIAFTTPKGDVDELRAHVRRMADLHNASGTTVVASLRGPNNASTLSPSDHVADTACGGMGMSGGMMMPPASASVADVDGGARLVLTPKDPAQLVALRRHASLCSSRMQQGDCGIMGREGPSKERVERAP
jgi:hypothetical protein